MIYNESPRRKQITKQVSWGHWFAFANILMATAISSVYLFSSPIADTPISFVYLISTWLGHTSFITFLGFVILIMPLCYKVTNLRLLRATASVIAAVGLALLAFDALFYNKTGFHLTISSAELVRTEAQGQMDAFGWLQWFYLVLLFIIWLMFQLVIANAIFKRIGRLQSINAAPYIIVTLVVCFISSHAIHVWADARLYTPVLKQDNMFPLSYPATAKTLMARYGLVDLEEREQQEKLQYNSEETRFNYPPNT
jgi:membrane-anchored protein YejM (alkaline phosphatase superfamily)